MPMSFDGLAANTSGWSIGPRARGTGSIGCAARIQHSLPIGHYATATAEHREPYESRGSRTVLGAPEGESPSGDSSFATEIGCPRYVRSYPVSDHIADIAALPKSARSGLMRTVTRSAFSFHIAIRTRVSKRGPSARYTECPCSRCMYGRADSPSARLHLGPPRQGCVSSSFGHPVWGNPRVRERGASRAARWPNSPEPSPEEEDFQTQDFRPNRNSRSSIGPSPRYRKIHSRPRATPVGLPPECFPSETRPHRTALR